jgi:hypothetical protein
MTFIGASRSTCVNYDVGVQPTLAQNDPFPYHVHTTQEWPSQAANEIRVTQSNVSYDLRTTRFGPKAGADYPAAAVAGHADAAQVD